MSRGSSRRREERKIEKVEASGKIERQKKKKDEGGQEEDKERTITMWDKETKETG